MYRFNFDTVGATNGNERTIVFSCHKTVFRSSLSGPWFLPTKPPPPLPEVPSNHEAGAGKLAAVVAAARSSA